MKKIIGCICFSVLISSTMPSFSEELQPDALLKIISQAVSGERARDHVSRLWLHERWTDLPAWQDAAGEAVMIMKERGFDDARTVDVPADGVTKFGDWTSPVGWDCRQATLEVLEPRRLPDDIKYLCNYLKNPTSVTIWSKPTPAEGLEAELFLLQSREPEELRKAKGKIILTDERAGGSGLNKLVDEYGILGIVTDYVEDGYKDFVHANQWHNQMSDLPLGWSHTQKDSKQFIFSISQAKGRYLRDLLQKGERVILRAIIDSRLYTDDVIPYVTGALMGSGTEDEEVFVGGHMFEHGANDNSTGVSAVIEAVGTLRDLIDAGILPRPKRTIRTWFGMELYGSMPFVMHNLERMRNKTVAALCMDGGAPDYDLSITSMHVMMSPNVCPSFTDAVLSEIVNAYYSRYSRLKSWSIVPYSQGTDTHYCEPMIGVPTNSLNMNRGWPLHHNSMDTIDKVDPRSLRDLSILNAVYLYYMASAGIDEVPLIADLTFSRNSDVLFEKTREIGARIREANTGAELGEVLSRGVKILEYQAGLQQNAQKSIGRILSPDENAELEKYIAPYLDDIDRIGDMSVNRIRRIANEKAAKDALTIDIPETRGGEWERTAASIIPKRKIVGTITLEGIPFDEWEEVTMSPRFWGRTNFASASYWWCDGKRNLLEIKELVEIEAGRPIRDFDLVKYYQFLSRHDLVEFVE